jgi:hypothetical protein
VRAKVSFVVPDFIETEEALLKVLLEELPIEIENLVIEITDLAEEVN